MFLRGLFAGDSVLYVNLNYTTIQVNEREFRTVWSLWTSMSKLTLPLDALLILNFARVSTTFVRRQILKIHTLLAPSSLDKC